MHGWIAYVGTVLIPARAFWDLDLYRWWMWQGLHQGVWPVLDGDWVYPAGAVVPMLLPALVDAVGTQPYAVAWSALITLLDAVAGVVLLRFAGRPARDGAARGEVVPPARDPAADATARTV